MANYGFQVQEVHKLNFCTKSIVRRSKSLATISTIYLQNPFSYNSRIVMSSFAHLAAKQKGIKYFLVSPENAGLSCDISMERIYDLGPANPLLSWDYLN